MAKIWPVYDGDRPTVGWPWADLSLSDAIEICELRPADFVSDLEVIPRFGPAGGDLTFAGFKQVVVEVDRGEALEPKWKSGFYKSRIKPKQAFGRLVRQALAAKLGKDNVVRVDWQPTTDSQGDDALAITVVIAPGAVQRLKEGAALDALISLRARLGEMRDDRIPIVQYMTEAELAQDARSQS